MLIKLLIFFYTKHLVFALVSEKRHTPNNLCIQLAFIHLANKKISSWIKCGLFCHLNIKFKQKMCRFSRPS